MYIDNFEIILYVRDQAVSTAFYTAILGCKPALHVPGMTEFEINSFLKLGLMPENGIVKILGNHTPHPALGNGIPRCELYLHVQEPEQAINIALQAGAVLVSAISLRDWGDRAGYVADPDGHIIAYAARF